MKTTIPARILTTATGFRWRTTPEWNNLNDELKNCKKLNIFKKLLKQQIIQNRETTNPVMNNSMTDKTDDDTDNKGEPRNPNQDQT